MGRIKLYLKYIIIVFIFYACQWQKNKEEFYFESDKIQFNELEQVRNLVLKNFEEMDAKFFSNKEQSIFKSYVNDFFKAAQDSCIPIYFDDIHGDWATLHFNIEELNFRFLIIRNNFGKFYYVGQTDKYLCYEFLKPYCKDYKDSMILNNFQLKPFSMTETSNEVKILNKLLNEYIRNKNKFSSYEYENRIFNIFHEMYKFNAPHSNILQISDFKFINHGYRNKRYFPLNYVSYEEVYTGIEHSRSSIGYLRLHKRNFGLFSWKLNYPKKGGDTLYSVEKYFIPSRKIDKKYF